MSDHPTPVHGGVAVLALAALAIAAPAHADALQSVAARLAPHASAMCRERGHHPACFGRVRMDDSRAVNASAGNGWITVTRGMVAATSPDELAFVVAHEMAHGIDLHWRSTPARELEADAIALRLVTSAGFDPDAPRSLLARFVHRHGPTHPTARQRVAALGIKED